MILLGRLFTCFVGNGGKLRKRYDRHRRLRERLRFLTAHFIMPATKDGDTLRIHLSSHRVSEFLL